MSPPALQPDPDNLPPRARLLTIRDLISHYRVTDRTVDRWLMDPDLNFPKPFKVRSRRYWYADAIDEFDAKQARA
jgi:predicted DNA-binding transcriptional regulator AlpA